MSVPFQCSVRHAPSSNKLEATEEAALMATPRLPCWVSQLQQHTWQDASLAWAVPMM